MAKPAHSDFVSKFREQNRALWEAYLAIKGLIDQWNLGQFETGLDPDVFTDTAHDEITHQQLIDAVNWYKALDTSLEQTPAETAKLVAIL